MNNARCVCRWGTGGVVCGHLKLPVLVHFIKKASYYGQGCLVTHLVEHIQYLLGHLVGLVKSWFREKFRPEM